MGLGARESGQVDDVSMIETTITRIVTLDKTRCAVPDGGTSPRMILAIDGQAASGERARGAKDQRCDKACRYRHRHALSWILRAT